MKELPTSIGSPDDGDRDNLVGLGRLAQDIEDAKNEPQSLLASLRVQILLRALAAVRKGQTKKAKLLRKLDESVLKIAYMEAYELAFGEGPFPAAVVVIWAIDMPAEADRFVLHANKGTRPTLREFMLTIVGDDLFTL